MMKISIIVPFFNNKADIGACIESIKSQLYCDFEAILVDDCGSDDSCNIALDSIGDDNRFKIISHPENRGLSAARNSGIDEACGDYIFFLDADDKLAYDEAMYDLLCVGDNYQIIQGDFIRSNKQVISGLNNWTNATNKLIDLKWLKSNDLYFIEGIIYEDVVWTMRAYSIVQRVANLQKATYFHNLREGSISRSKFTKRNIESGLIVLAELLKLPADDFIRQRIGYYTIFLLKNLLLSDFSDTYKHDIYIKITSLGANKIKFDRNTLPKFSRILALFRRSYWASSLVCKLYKRYKRC